MTQEVKELLLKDLCARVPYHPKGRVVNACNGAACDEWLTCATFQMFTCMTNACRLYLRPMSSMTEEEAMEYANCGNIIANSPQNNYLIPNPNCVDWLNSHHFDYRGLIEKGLALAAPEEMYK